MNVMYIPKTRNGGSCHRNIYPLTCQISSQKEWDTYLTTVRIISGIHIGWQNLAGGNGPRARYVSLVAVGIFVRLIGIVGRGIICMRGTFVGRRISWGDRGTPLSECWKGLHEGGHDRIVRHCISRRSVGTSLGLLLGGRSLFLELPETHIAE